MYSSPTKCQYSEAQLITWIIKENPADHPGTRLGGQLVCSKYAKAYEEKIPELLLLGTLEDEQHILNNGLIVAIKVALLDEKKFIVKAEYVGRWYGTSDEVLIK